MLYCHINVVYMLVNLKCCFQQPVVFISSSLLRGAHFFPHPSCSRKSHLYLHTFKDKIPLREACPSPHWWSWSPWRQRCHDKKPELLVAWWWQLCCDDNILYGPYTSRNYQQTCIYGKSSKHLLFLTSLITWGSSLVLDLENSSVLLRDEISSRLHPAVKWKCNRGGVQKYD